MIGLKKPNSLNLWEQKRKNQRKYPHIKERNKEENYQAYREKDE